MSSFHLKRFGLVNFWYHSDTIFEFSNGRLFVRGANGSGKSVSTTMAVPFLLDGDKRPSRLDPFGSQDRRMIDLLLGNKHVSKREEGTGYLYTEYRKGDTFVTVGIGLNGKRRESDNTMQTWYFILFNKRIGYDIKLYEEKIVSGESRKFPLTMGELTDHIGGDGEVTDSQQRYMELVNQNIYRFKTTQEFKELIGVLLQLRSPKLSNAVKASEVSNVLSDALPELSQSELAPLSSSLESMDSLQEKKARLEKELEFLAMLADAYDTYNQFSLYEKAKHLIYSEKRLDESIELIKKYKVSEAIALENKNDLEHKRTEQTNIKETLHKNIALLNGHALFTMEEELDKITEVLQNLEHKLQSTTEAMENNATQQREVEERIKKNDGKEYKAAKNRKDVLSELEALADDTFFLSHTTLSQYFEQNLKDFSDAGFKNWKEILQEYHTKVQEIASQLHFLQARLEHEEQLQRNLAIEEEHVKGIEVEIRALEKEHTKNADIVENDVMEWAEGARHFQVQPNDLLEARGILQGIGELLADSSTEAVIDWLNNLFHKRLTGLQEERANITAAIGILQKKIADTETQIYELSAHKEIRPALTVSELTKMEHLRTQNIRTAYFYESVEFLDHIDASVKEAIEGAITRAGLLTALIVHESDLSMVADSTTVAQKGSYKKENMLTYLRSVPINGLSENDIDAVLQTISIVPHEEGYILETGEFRSGMIGGLAPQYEDLYIGKSAREQIRARRLNELQKQIEELKSRKYELDSECYSIENKQRLLQKERDVFPTMEVLIGSLARYENKNQERVIQLSMMERLHTVLRLYQNDTQVARNALYYAAESMELPLTYTSYQRALIDIEHYKNMLNELRMVHSSWLDAYQSISNCLSEKENLLNFYDYLIDARTELEQDIKRNKSYEAMYVKKIHDLGDTDVKKEIEMARKNLQETDKLLETNHKLINEAENSIRILKERLEKEQPLMEEWLRLFNAWTKLYEKEISFGLVPHSPSPYQVIGDLEETYRTFSLNTILSVLKDAEAYAHRELVDYFLKQSHVTFPFEISAKEMEDARWQIFRQHCSRQFLVFAPQYVENTPREVHSEVADQLKLISGHIQKEEQKLFERVLIDVIGTAIHEKVRSAKKWEQDANEMLQRVSGTIQMRLEWVPLTSKEEDQISTTELLSYLSKESVFLTPLQKEKVRLHFTSKINEARKKCKDDTTFSMFEEMKKALDYRKWYRFDMFITRKGIPEERFTNKIFGELSGGEKAMSIYSPLFAAIAAKYSYAAPDAPRVISLDEAFAGIDSENIAQMFQLVHDFEFDYIMNSQVLWGCYDTVEELSIAQILRSVESPVLAVARYYWDGKEKHLLSVEDNIEEYSRDAG
ncbi:TIGR02680 family protein [Paenibacillus sp. FSL M7-0896]|uniref:TIGR02680 family protein n=1 Tax=Paenibacillus sp. FSL M7-0896 TaxID=2921610 RepID=UPI0030D9CD9C